MKKWRNKALSLLLVCLMLVSGLGFTAAAPEPAEAASVSGQTIVNTARQYIGKVPYVYGGEKIDGTNPGADCSGFICRIYEKYGINMWRVRTHLRDYGTNIGTDLNKAQVGDIIWFDGHVAIYSGKQGSKHMIIHETGGSFQNVVETSTSVVNAKLRGIIRIPGVTGSGTTASVSQVTFSEVTDPAYTSKESITNTNAVLVSKITKPAGVHVSQMGIELYSGDTILKSYSEAVSNVSDSTTVYHSWFDVNKELGRTLDAGTTYGYRFFGVFDGVKVSGARQSFTTTGTPTRSFSIVFYQNESLTTTTQTNAWVGQTIEEVCGGRMPSAQEKPGYVFDHWYVIENGQEVPIDAGTYFRWTQEVKVYPAYVEAVSEDDPDIILPPPDSTSDEETHHVTFMDLTNMTTYADYDIENGAAFTLPTRTPSRDGYTFVGWFTSASGGSEITAQTICDLEDDATFYARFEKIAEPEDPSDGPQPGSVDMTLTIGSPMLTINGDRTFIDSLGTTPIIRDGRTLLPVRAVIEGMGGTVEWDGGTRMVTLWVDGHSLRLTLDSRMVQDGRNDWFYLDVAPVSIGGRTMLPIRFIVEYFGGQVVWDGDSRTVTITY